MVGKKCNSTKEELETSVQDWLRTQAATWCEDGVGKPVARYDIAGDYAEK